MFSLSSDSDGDMITISSDEELVEALGQFDGGLFKLYLLKSKQLLLNNNYCERLFYTDLQRIHQIALLLMVLLLERRNQLVVNSRMVPSATGG